MKNEQDGQNVVVTDPYSGKLMNLERVSNASSLRSTKSIGFIAYDKWGKFLHYLDDNCIIFKVFHLKNNQFLFFLLLSSFISQFKSDRLGYK